MNLSSISHQALSIFMNRNKHKETNTHEKRSELQKLNGGWVPWLTLIIPALWKAKAGRVRGKPGQHGESLSLLKILNEKICQAWWQVHVVPATWEAEAGELLKPRRRWLQ